MKKVIFQKQWNWFSSGLALGTMFLLAIFFVKPIGVSTPFVSLDGIVWDATSSELVTKDTETKSGYSSSNAYLNKSGGKYAKNVANPWNYSLVFVIAMIFGGFVASRLQFSRAEKAELVAPRVWRERFGDSAFLRYLFAFLGGILVLVGARLAGGCTSGHMMSGMMQTSISGYLFASGAFAVAIPAAILIYKKRS